MQVCITVIILVILDFGMPYSYEDINRLEAYLLNGSRYNMNTRPRRNQSEAVELSIVHSMLELGAFDITEGVILTSGFLKFDWVDEYLAWNATEFNGITEYSLPFGKIWHPNIGLYRPSKNALYFNEHNPAFVASSGHVTMYSMISGDLKCTTDTTLYPFDSYQCVFAIISMKYTNDDIIIHSPLSFIDTTYFTKNKEWHLIKTSAGSYTVGQSDTIMGKSIFGSTCFFSRRVKFKLIHDFLPVSLLVLINLVTFVVPLDSGERLGFSVTVYLAFIFSSESVLAELPKNSLNISVTSYMFMVVNLINCMTVTWSVIAVRLSKLDHTRVHIPEVLLQITKWIERPYICIRRRPNENSVTPLDNDGESVVCPTIQAQAFPSTSPKDKTIKAFEDTTRFETVSVTWVCVSKALDKLAFRVMLFIFVFLVVFSVAFLRAKKAI